MVGVGILERKFPEDRAELRTNLDEFEEEQEELDGIGGFTEESRWETPKIEWKI